MIEQTITIRNQSGLHARPAAVLVQEAGRYAAGVKIRKGDKTVDAKSILGVLSLAVSKGQEITIITDGNDEKEALSGIVSAIQSGLGEGE